VVNWSYVGTAGAVVVVRLVRLSLDILCLAFLQVSLLVFVFRHISIRTHSHGKCCIANFDKILVNHAKIYSKNNPSYQVHLSISLNEHS